uniref:Kinesin-like protein n=1 Tax=Ananas comosus var. bracteatus TaxID=296719 RepID=A0A6V7QE50_ANACO|nr:unnamed protein product [Ananas comosus var. bracteatus]
MSLRSRTNPPRSPLNKKENLDEGRADKRRKVAVGKMVGATSNLRSRPLEENVERLLNEKMKGKNKNDFKGKSEQMMEYIKKLRACIKWLTEQEDGNLTEMEKLRNLLDSEEKNHAEIAAQLRNTNEELNSTIEELRKQLATLEEKYRKEEAEKMGAIRSCEEEKEARLAAESRCNALSAELDKAGHEAKRLNDQIKMLQETNKRLQEYNTSLQQYNSNLQADAQKNGEAISKLQKEKNAMMETLNGLRDHVNSVKNQLDISRASQQEASKQKEELKKELNCFRNELQQVRDDRDHQLNQVQCLMAEIVKYKELTGKSALELDNATSKTNALEEACSSQRDIIKTLKLQLAAANEKLKMADLTAMETMSENEEKKKMLKDLQDRLADAEQQISEGEKLRKKLHNTILELKGNIRVFCRVRPLLPDGENNGVEGAALSYPTSTEYLGRGIDLMHNSQKYSFTFDKVFDQDASQEDVFVEISQLVQSALDGYKVCIFAYGQTGSGKTYTMMGKPDFLEQKGLIPRSLEQIFQASQSLLLQGWRFKMQASMLEIYNETIRDLLNPNRSGSQDTGASKYLIKHDANGNTHVSDLTVVDVCSINEVSFLLRQAAQSRSVGKTQMNEQSSRSHFVFTLRISGVNESTDQQVQGVLNLIDLAGSERLAKSGSTGDRLKETQAINKSLSCLSDVIFSIAKKEDHVPFRNSKLTYLLQPCLGGDSKTLMFVNISPEASSTGESICSLRFAARVNACEIGVPRRQTQMRTLDSRLSYG